MNSLSTSGSTGAATSTAFTCTWTCLPANCGTRQSAGKSTVRVFSSSLDRPTRPCSIAGNMTPEPITLLPFSTPSAGRRSSPACDQVSRVTRSPSCAGRPAGCQVRRCRRRFSIICSMSASVTSAVWRITSSLATSMSPKSGTTSKVATNCSALSPARSMRGLPARRSSCSRTAESKVSRSRPSSASARICGPKRCSITFGGILPGRKPLIRAVRATSRRRPPIWVSRRSSGRVKVRRRSRVPVVSIEACMWTPATGSTALGTM